MYFHHPLDGVGNVPVAPDIPIDLRHVSKVLADGESQGNVETASSSCPAHPGLHFVYGWTVDRSPSSGGGDIFKSNAEGGTTRKLSGSTAATDSRLARRIEDLENVISRFVPKEFQGNIKKAVASSFNILLLDNNGKVGIMGQVGTPLETAMPDYLKDGSVQLVDLTVTLRTAAGIDKDGKLYVWGENFNELLELPEGIENAKITSIMLCYLPPAPFTMNNFM